MFRAIRRRAHGAGRRAPSRQGRRDLEVIGASLGMQANDMILGGACSRVRTGYVGGALRPGPIQDRMNDGRLRYDDYSTGAIAMMLAAVATGPAVRTGEVVPGDRLPGPDNDGLHRRTLRRRQVAPHHVAVRRGGLRGTPRHPPGRGDHAFQRADRYGNVQGWGAFGDARWGLWAAERVIVSVEEIVPTEVVRRDPNRTLIPGSRAGGRT
ncbi:MAG: CoA transferase [Dehalococcoidia bacterium]|nr:CoA transferase [Dehalococcoidia bacterium]